MDDILQSLADMWWSGPSAFVVFLPGYFFTHPEKIAIRSGMAAIRDAKQTIADSRDESPVKAGKFSTKAESGNGDDDPNNGTSTGRAGPDDGKPQPSGLPSSQKSGQSPQPQPTQPPLPPSEDGTRGAPDDDSSSNDNNDNGYKEHLRKLEENKAKSPAKSFDDTMFDALDTIEKFREMQRPGWIFNGKTGIGIDATMGKEYGIRAYDDLVSTTPSLENGKPVYLTAITNNAGYFSEESRKGYNKIYEEISETPLIGYWKSEKTDKEFFDAVYPANFDSQEDVIRNAKLYNQESVFALLPNGDTDVVDTGIVH